MILSEYQCGQYFVGLIKKAVLTRIVFPWYYRYRATPHVDRPKPRIVDSAVAAGDGMKRRKLEKRLRELGFGLRRHGRSHDIWGHGQKSLSVPRHREIQDALAKSILRDAAAAQPRRPGAPSD